MRNPQSMLALVVVSIISCAAGTLWTRTPAAHAQRSASHKWEYCAITDFSLNDDEHGGHEVAATISYFGTGNRTEQVMADHDIVRYVPLVQNATCNAIAKLGSEGWEMVGRVSLGLNPPEAGGLFFKRLK